MDFPCARLIPIVATRQCGVELSRAGNRPSARNRPFRPDSERLLEFLRGGIAMGAGSNFLTQNIPESN